ncbi:MAG: type VI secretion system baseplate subunit TssK [Prevotella sp.]|nr:type VI secretion system baseplate subunit TssK [Prevotella sp.]
MDINARINWMPGMEITAQTFREIDECLDYRQKVALRAALGSNRMGLVPGAPFSGKGIFVKSTFEIERLQCLALLPTGRILNVDEKVVVNIPMLFGSQYYLTVGFGEGQTAYEKEGVPYVRPEYAYAIHTFEELEEDELFPIARFNVNEGVFSLDEDYIPPSLSLNADPRFGEYLDRYTEKVQTLATHQNMAEGEGKRALQRYTFILKSYNRQEFLQHFVLLTQEIAQAVDYYVMRPNTEQPQEVPVPHQTDIQQWLGWLDSYLLGAATVLDGVVLEDNTIDYEALLAQAKKELYEQLHPELIEKLLLETKEELQNDMKQLSDNLTSYINDTLYPKMKDEVSESVDTQMTQLSDHINEEFKHMGVVMQKDLYEALYVPLFDNLFNALYVPEPEEKEFVPLI